MVLAWTLQCDVPYRGPLKKFFFLQIIRQSGCANLIDSHASVQSSHGCTLNTVALWRAFLLEIERIQNEWRQNERRLNEYWTDGVEELEKKKKTLWKANVEL